MVVGGEDWGQLSLSSSGPFPPPQFPSVTAPPLWLWADSSGWTTTPLR